MKRPLFSLFCLTALGICLWYPRGYTPDPVFVQGDSCFVTAEGRVLTYEPQNNSISLTLQDCRIRYQGQTYSCERLLVTVPQAAPIQSGNRLSVTGSLSSFQPARNPGNFDWRAYYLARHISYRIYAQEITVTDFRTDLLREGLLHAKQELKDRLDGLTGSGQTASLLKALLLGDKASLEEDTREKYEDSGILHILTVSGLHISLLGGAVLTLCRLLHLPSRLRGPAAVAFVFLYWQLCGAGLSATRALLMFACLALAPLFGRTYDSLSALSLAGILILWDSPLMLFQSGFQLSFAAILGICLVCPAFLPEGDPSAGLAGILLRLRSSLCFGLGLQLTLLPVTLYHFFRYPLYGLILNLAVLPLVTPLFLCGSAGLAVSFLWLPLGRFPVMICHLILSWYDLLCSLALSLPGASCTLGRPKLSRIFLYYLILAGFCLWRKKKHSAGADRGPDQNRVLSSARLYLPISLLPLLLLVLLFPVRTGILSVTFLDVGQGDCAFLLTPEGTSILIDGGSSDQSRVTEDRLIPFLESQGISSLDYVFLSHSDEDHINAVTGWLDAGYSIGMVILPRISDRLASEASFQNLLTSLTAHRIPFRFFSLGDIWREGELSLFCLAPAAPEEAGASDYSSLNAASQVLLAEYQGIRLLFTGDCCEDGEARLVQELKEREITCQILKAGHHGSDTATGDDLLTQLNPRIVVISCGIRNRYGHPHPDMIERVEQHNSSWYTTASCGAVMLSVQNGQVRLQTMLSPIQPQKQQQ